MKFSFHTVRVAKMGILDRIFAWAVGPFKGFVPYIIVQIYNLLAFHATNERNQKMAYRVKYILTFEYTFAFLMSLIAH